MDLTRPVRFRGLDYNTAASAGPGEPISGIAIEQVLKTGAPGVGYVEKRSMSDGFDASDVWLGRRMLRARVTVYGLTRADLFDRAQELMNAHHPTASYLEDVGAKGYLPITYEVPTMNVADFPEENVGDGFGWRQLQMYGRPLAQPDEIIDRDRIGGSSNRGLAIPYSLAWDIIDPRVYAQEQQSYDLDEALSLHNVRITNRGGYPTPVSLLLIVPASASAGSVTFAFGNSAFTITIPDSTETQIIRYSARQKVLTVEEEGAEVQRMDLLDLLGADTHPQIMPGDGSFSMHIYGEGEGSTLIFNDGSLLFYNEAFA